MRIAQIVEAAPKFDSSYLGGIPEVPHEGFRFYWYR